MTSEVNSKVVFVLVYLKSDLPTPDRENLQIREKKQKQTKTKTSGDSTKSSEILFFSPEQD